MKKILSIFILMLVMCSGYSQTLESMYIKSYNWDNIPLGNSYLKCVDCNYHCGQNNTGNYLKCIGVVNDTIFSLDMSNNYHIDLGISYPHIHRYIIVSKKEYNDSINKHLKLFKHELLTDTVYHNLDEYETKIFIYFNKTKTLNDPKLFSMDINLFNSLVKYYAYQKLDKIAPYGYIYDYSWHQEYNNLKFDFTYINNNNKRTIKYIKIYWDALNDVNDIREQGVLSCTGPVEQYDSGRWKFDNTSVYLSNDVTYLRIRKLQLIYVNGTNIILTGKNIKINQ